MVVLLVVIISFFLSRELKLFKNPAFTWANGYGSQFAEFGEMIGKIQD